MLADLFFLAGFIYFFTKIAPKAIEQVKAWVEAIGDRADEVRASEVKAYIYRTLLERNDQALTTRVLVAVDKAWNDVPKLQAILAGLEKLATKNDTPEQKTG